MSNQATSVGRKDPELSLNTSAFSANESEEVTSMQLFRSALGRRLGMLTIGASMAVGALTEPKAAAGLMMAPGTTLPGNDYIALGQQISQGRNLWVQGEYANGTSFYVNALRINERFALTINPNTHGTLGPFELNLAGNGNNYLTSPGASRSIVSVTPYPDSSIDAAIIELGGALLPGPDLVMGNPPPYQSKVYVVGFGDFGLTNGSMYSQDGNIRGYETKMYSSVLGGLDPAYYASATISTAILSGTSLPGGPMSYDSGGLVTDEYGIPIGYTKSGGGNTSFRIDNFVKFSPPLRNVINENSQISPVPEPASTGLLMAGVLALAALASRRRRSK